MLATVRRLEERVGARFPDRDLLDVVRDLAALVEEVADGAADVRRRIRHTRLLSRLGVVAILAVTATIFWLAVRSALDDRAVTSSLDWLPLLESGINDLVFAAIALWFLWSLPERVHRSSLLALLHRLRSLAHVVDMHQLTKDPERLRVDFRPTPRSADPGLDRNEMESYLDYCTELLSLVGKTAALVAEQSQDAVVLDAVSNLETLTTSMSRSIWQKISLLPD